MPTYVENQYPVILPPDGQLRLAFVGEAPADEEIKSGRPFTAASYGWNAGSELDLWLRSVGILRPHCFIGNLSMEQAPGNDIKRMFLDSKCTMPNPVLTGHIEVLKSQLEELRPHCIVALGNNPSYILTGKTGLFSKNGFWAGSILPCTLVPGLKVIPIAHPAFIIRGLFALRQMMGVFLRRAIEESNYPELRLPEYELVLDPDPDTIFHHLDRLRNSPKIGFDIENPGRSPIVCISFSDSKDWSISIPFNRGTGHRWHRYIEQEIWFKISKLLSGDALKIAHNLNYDFTWLTTHKVHVRPPYWDTMQSHHACYPDLSRDELKKMKLNSLAACTALYTKHCYYKSDFKVDNDAGPKYKGSEYEFWKYNAKDSVVLHEIQEATERDLNKMGQLSCFQHDMSVWKPLMAMSLKGIKINQESKKEVSTLAETYITEIQEQIGQIAGREVVVTSPVDVKKLLYSDLGLPIQYDRKTKRISSDAVALHKLTKKTGHKIPMLIVDHRRFSKFKSTYADVQLHTDGRFHCTYNQARTTTFRLSSSEYCLGSGANLQNIPTRKRDEERYDDLILQYKKSFLPDKGMLFGKRDLKQAEAMVVAYLARDVKQIEDFANNVDTHSVAASYLFNCDYKTIFEGKENGDPKYKLWRRFGKTVRHATNYRMGKRTLRDNFFKEGFDIPEKECGRMISAMLSGIPMVVNWQMETEHTVKEKRILTTPLGRRRYFMGKLTDDTIREAIAFVPQCTVAQVLNIGLDRCYMWLEQQSDPDIFDLLMNIHDAIIWQSPEESIYQHAELISHLMEVPLTIHGRILTIPSDLAIGPNWGQLKEIK